MKYVAPRDLTEAGSIHVDLSRLGLVPSIIWGEVVDVATYATHVDAFDDLTSRAAEPNVFADPSVVVALVHAQGSAATTRVVLAWHGRGPSRRLVGILPIFVKGRGFGSPVPMLSARGHEYTVLSTPVLDSADAREALAALFDAIHASPDRPRLLALPFLSDRGPVAVALADTIAARGLRMHVFERYDRAGLRAVAGGSEAFLATRFEGRKRKKHRQERRKLAEAGGAFTRHRGLDAREALEELLALEAASWKGRRGSAIVCDPVDATFMRRALGGLADRGLAEIHALRLGGRAIAMGLLLRSGGNAWYHKVAFDEAHARLSPGVEMSLELTAALLDEPGFQFADSCALRGGGMLTGSWADAQPIADVLIDLTPGGSRAFDVAVSWETARRRLRSIAKAAYLRFSKGK